MSNDKISACWLWIVLVLWLVVVEPLTLFGYGSDTDAWGVAQTATTLYATGHYVPSRAMGFPLLEFAATPLVAWGGWFLSNQLAVVAGAAIILALYQLAELGKLRHSKLIIPAIAFLPIVVTNASSTMDFIPALALLWWAYVAYCRRRYYTAAVLIGIACGFRVSSGAFLLPVVIGAHFQKESWTKLFKMCALCIVVAILAYSPALLTFGTSRLSAYFHRLCAGANWSDEPPMSPRARILAMGHNALTFFGVLQTIAVLGILAWVVVRKNYRIAWAHSCAPHQAAFHVSAFVLWGICFLILPDKAEYLFPVLISLTFLIDRLPTRGLVAACALVFLSYHLVDVNTIGGTSGHRTLTLSFRPGYTWHHVNVRRWLLDTRQAVTEWPVEKPTLLMFGSTWIPKANPEWARDETTKLFKRKHGELYLSSRIQSEERLKWFADHGIRMLVWKGDMSEYCRKGNINWQQYVQVVPDLEHLLGRHFRGEPEHPSVGDDNSSRRP